jgi:hypothetical protein
MRCFIARYAVAAAAVLALASSLSAQPPADTSQKSTSATQQAEGSSQKPADSTPQLPPDAFRWVDFHNPKDQDIIVWVTRSLAVEDWSAIREIGVKYDAALVVTTDRKSPQSLPEDDTFSVWSVSLTSHAITMLLSGVNLRIRDWQHFADGFDNDLIALYDDCRNCAATTYFTAFYYDFTQHAWGARWLRGGKGVPLWNASQPSDIAMTQLYELAAEGDGHVALFIWSHLDYGKQKAPEDYIFRFDRDPFSGLDRTVELTGEQLKQTEMRICRGQDAVEGMMRGQDSEVCQQLLPRAERHPVTTPPGNNHGRMGSSVPKQSPPKPTAATPQPSSNPPKPVQAAPSK